MHINSYVNGKPKGAQERNEEVKLYESNGTVDKTVFQLLFF